MTRRDVPDGKLAAERSAVEDMKARMIRAMDEANRRRGREHEVPGLREAIQALPDRGAAARLPAEVRSFLEREIEEIER